MPLTILTVLLPSTDLQKPFDESTDILDDFADELQITYVVNLRIS